MAGKPRGPWSDKKFRQALDLAVNQETADGVKKLQRIAENLADAALNKEGWAITAVRDTLDGRPAQAIVGDDEADPVRLITEIRRTIVDPRNSDS